MEITTILYCPITKQPIHTPVLAQDGHFYEKDALTDWFKNKNISPITRKEISKVMYEPIKLKEVFDKFCEQHPEIAEDRYVPSKSYVKYKNEVRSIIHSGQFEKIMDFCEFCMNDGVFEFDHFKKFYLECIDTKIINHYLNNLVDINLVRQSGYNIVYFVAEYGNSIFLDEVLKRGVNMNQRYNNNQSTPIMMATKNKKIENALLLLERGASFREVDNEGNSVLSYACTINSYDLVVRLVELGADISLQNKAGECPVEMTYDPKIMNYLLDQMVIQNIEIKPKYITKLLLNSSFEGIFEHFQKLMSYEIKRKNSIPMAPLLPENLKARKTSIAA